MQELILLCIVMLNVCFTFFFIKLYAFSILQLEFGSINEYSYHIRCTCIRVDW